MNQPEDPVNPVPPPLNPEPLPPRPRARASVPTPLIPAPLPPDLSFGLLIETLLKRPVQLVHGLQQTESARYLGLLAAAAVIGLALYGLLVGAFSGGTQLLAAPVKISLGSLLSVLICLPSLYIFACLAGAEVSLRGLAGVLSAALALEALLLLGFAPVAWVFSQSTDSIAFMGTLHLLFWFVAVLFGLRLLRTLMDSLRIADRSHLRVWTVIFLFVSLQMTTALRPIIGRADHWLPTEKKFFLAHWMENVFAGGGSVD